MNKNESLIKAKQQIWDLIYTLYEIPNTFDKEISTLCNIEYKITKEILNLSKTQLELELEKTYYTHEEWNVYKKIIKNMELENIKNILDYKLASKEINEEKYKFMCNSIYFIQETYYKLKFEGNNENISVADVINKMIKENEND